MVPIKVPMGGVAYLDKDTQVFDLWESVGGRVAKREHATSDKPGMSTKGLADCFAVAVMGSRGAILAHVSAYLGASDPDENHKKELKAMKDSFALLWNTHRGQLQPPTVVIIPGPWTNAGNMQRLYAQIFPQLAAIPEKVFPCEKMPNPRGERHGTVVVMVGPSNELFVEDVKKF